MENSSARVIAAAIRLLHGTALFRPLSATKYYACNQTVSQFEGFAFNSEWHDATLSEMPGFCHKAAIIGCCSMNFPEL
jgi:hypothetical protein